MKRVLLILSLVALSALRLGAQQNTAMPFSVIPRDIRSLAMGGANALENVSALTFGENFFDGQLSYLRWAPSSPVSAHSANAVIYGKIADKVGVKGSFSMDFGPGYTPFSESGVPGETYLPRDIMVNFGASYKFFPFLGLGASMRYLSSIPSPENETSAIAADIFLSGQAGPVCITAGVTSLGSTVKSYHLEDFKLPMAAVLAARWSQTFGKIHRVEAVLQGDWFISSGPRIAGGAAYTFNDIATVRAGYNYGGNTPLPSFFSAGAGVNLWGVNINAAVLFGSSAPINGTFQIGLGYTIKPGKTTASKADKKADKKATAPSTPSAEDGGSEEDF